MEDKKNILSIRIKELRTELGLTQEELAKKLGLNNKSSIANYESGYSIPSDEIKLKMCNIFGCSMDYLMGLTSYKNPKKDLEFELFKYRMTSTEYYKIKQIIIDSSYDFNKLLFDDNLSNRIKEILKTFYAFVSDYDFEQMVSKLGGRRTSYGSILFPKNIDNKKLNIRLKEISKVSSEKFKKLLESLDESKFIEDFYPFNRYYMCPVYGRIAAGEPNWAEECLEGYLPIDPNLMNIVNPEECFFLRVNGESMNKVIKNGAFALIRKQDIVENGEIAAVLINGHDATLKKFTKQKNLIILEPMSDNPNFTTQVYNKINEIRIIGKYIGKMEMN